MAARADEMKLRHDELMIVREFDAPAALVFRLWESRDHMIRWWGPRDFTVTSLDWELKVGRAWRATMEAEAYGRSSMGGVIHEVVPGQRIVFSFRWDEGSGDQIDTLVTVTLTETGGKTVQTFYQTPFSSVESRDSHVGGWTQVIDKQQAYVEAAAKGAAR